MNGLDPERAAFVESRGKMTPVMVPAWPRAEKNLAQVQLEVTWVRFSTLNHRIRIEQLREIRSVGRQDFFTRNPLGREAQDAVYRILRGQGRFDELKEDLRERGQQAAAIITADGMLINGNRRTAALRSLWEEGFLAARYVTCLVLPRDATREELVDLETELQEAESFEEDYSWINRAMLIEEHYDAAGKNWDRVAKRMHRPAAEVHHQYRKLQYVRQLVELCDGARDFVDFVEHESVFDELVKHIKNKPSSDVDEVRTVYFLGAVAGAKYRDLRDLRRPDAAQLVRRELEGDPALKPILEAAAASTAAGDEDDPLADLLGEAEPLSPLHDLLGFVATKRPEATVSMNGGDKLVVQDVLRSISTSIGAAAYESREEKSDQSALHAPLMRADKAIAELERLLNALPKARKYDEWDEVALAEKIMIVERLVKKISVIRDIR